MRIHAGLVGEGESKKESDVFGDLIQHHVGILIEGFDIQLKDYKVRYVPIDASVMAEVSKHLAGRRADYVLQTRNGTPLRLGNVLEDFLHPIPDELGPPNWDARLSQRAHLGMGIQRCQSSGHPRLGGSR